MNVVSISIEFLARNSPSTLPPLNRLPFNFARRAKGISPASTVSGYSDAPLVVDDEEVTSSTPSLAGSASSGMILNRGFLAIDFLGV